MREGYDTQQVCMRGHQQTASYHNFPDGRRSFCADCGCATIYKCPNCGKEITGEYYVSGVISIGGSTAVPICCDGCGARFPWAETEQVDTGTAAETPNPSRVLIRLCTRFPLVVRELRHRHNARATLDVTDEYDVQDLLHALLHQFFDDVRPEEVVPSYAGKSSRVDFLLNNEAIAIEAKMTRAGLAGREVGEQLIIDIARYQAHPKCKHLFCLVYDPEHRIRNPRGLEGDLSKEHGNLTVSVFIVS